MNENSVHDEMKLRTVSNSQDIVARSKNKVAVASAAVRVASFIFGRFFGQKLEIPLFCVVFVKKTMFRTYFVYSSLPCFSSLIFVDF